MFVEYQRLGVDDEVDNDLSRGTGFLKEKGLSIEA